MSIKQPEELLEHMLQDMYYAEHKLIKALPKMARAASDDKLVRAFEDHLEETRTQVSRLEEVMELLGLEVARDKCEAMDGLIQEGEEIIKEIKKGELRDVALIAAAQKVEHYEIAAYGTLCELAHVIGNSEVEALLKKTLKEEKQTDEKLTRIAESGINERVMNRAA